MRENNGLKVSVVIPVLNAEAFISEAISSVLDQSFENIELIVIDDGSTDRTAQEVRSTIRKYPNRPIKFISRENRGVCCTLNEGLALSTGKYFAYLGADDVWEKDKLEIQVGELERTGHAAAYSDCWVVNTDGDILSRYGQQFAYKSGDIYSDIIWMKFQPASPTVLFRRKEVESVGGFDESHFCEDRDLWIRITRRNKVVFVDKPLARYRIHGNNVSTSNVEGMHLYAMQVLDATLERDPSLESSRSELQALIDSLVAASFYEALELTKARKAALAALKKSPFSKIAYRTLLLSLLGKRAISALRVRSRRQAD